MSSGETRAGGSTGTARWIVCWTVVEIDCAMLAVVDEIVCARSPSSPGLRIRIEIEVLHPVQGAGAASPQFHCQFQIQVPAPAGGDGAGEPDPIGPLSQFQVQFHIQVPGAIGGGSSGIADADGGVVATVGMSLLIPVGFPF